MKEALAGPSPGSSRRAALRREAVLLLLAIAGVGTAARLAVWQLDRAAQKEALQAQQASRGQAPVLTAAYLARQLTDVSAQAYRRVRVAGHWLAGRTLYLDNRQMDGKVGFFVVTPLQLDGSPEVVLVQRGWVARNFAQRATLPIVPTPPGPVAVEGVVAAAPSRLFEFAPAASGPIRQNIEPSTWALETGLPVLPLTVVESATAANAGDGLLRHWPPPASDVQMHYGYAFQWSAIGCGILVLYVWFRIIRPRRGSA
ncbi:MAG: SURF1 family protein [Pseudomonadota bacterium]|nr:SURF1 family protein [Pseudomonadota bacterium]